MLSKVIFAVGLADALSVEEKHKTKLVQNLISDYDLDDSLLESASQVPSAGAAGLE